MPDRRQFIKTGLAATAVLGTGAFPFGAFAKEDEIKLTILHTNDMHSHIEPISSGKYKGMGGMAARAALVEKIRQQEKNVLLLDAGDIFQGTPYFNFFGGEPELKLMSKMKYDAATIGNHDFDAGLEGLYRQLPHAAFPFLSANYDFSDTILAGKIEPYRIFKREKLKIGVYGLGVELQGLVPDKLFGKTKYLDPLQKALETEQALKEKECNLIICLSHLGNKYKNSKISDQIIAKKTNFTNLIIGGHTHTFLEEPQLYQNEKKQPVLVNQVGWAGIYLGRIDYHFDKKRNKKRLKWQTVMVDKKSIAI